MENVAMNHLQEQTAKALSPYEQTAYNIILELDNGLLIPPAELPDKKAQPIQLSSEQCSMFKKVILESLPLEKDPVFQSLGTPEYINAPQKCVPEGADFGMYVTGDGMRPFFVDGQLIYVHRCDILSSGEVGVFRVNGDLLLRQYNQSSDGMVTLTAYHNRPVVQISANDRFEIIGKVLN